MLPRSRPLDRRSGQAYTKRRGRTRAVSHTGTRRGAQHGIPGAIAGTRDDWCAGRESNPHGCDPGDFKSPASTGSATRAWERGRQEPSGLQSSAGGSFSRRFLAHRTTMGRRIAEKLISPAILFASNVPAAHAPARIVPHHCGTRVHEGIRRRRLRPPRAAAAGCRGRSGRARPGR